MLGKVLLIEDDPEIRSAVTIRLRAANYYVLCDSDGESGLARALSLHPDVILLDVRLPGIDGFEVARRLKSRPELTRIPVIFLSACAQDSARRAAFAVGGVDYISKPYEPQRLLSAVAAAIHPGPCRGTREASVA